MNSQSSGEKADTLHSDLANRFAWLTSAAKGAIGVLWFAGPAAGTVVARRFLPARGGANREHPVRTYAYGHWEFDSLDEPVREDVLLVKLGPDEFEVHAHGGGRSREWLRQTLMAEGFAEMSLEGVLTEQQGSALKGIIADWLLRCESEQAANRLLRQEMAWKELVRRLQTALNRRDAKAILNEVEAVRSRQSFVRYLVEPRTVVLGGAPNVGKSSLINALSGFARAIVHAEPGTTRDVVTQRLVFGGWSVEIADTAGQREANEEIEAAGVKRARQSWQTADFRIAVVDATCSERLPLSWEPPPDLIVANKLDLPGAEVRPGELGVSALSGLGLERLQEALVAELVRRFPEETEPLPLSEELLACLTQLGGAAEREAWEECGRELAGLVRICRLS